MPMKPGPDEDQASFMSRCVPEMMSDGSREQDVAVAACLNMFRTAREPSKKIKTVKPEIGEQQGTFLDRCVASGADPAQCKLIWLEAQRHPEPQPAAVYPAPGATAKPAVPPLTTPPGGVAAPPPFKPPAPPPDPNAAPPPDANAKPQPDANAAKPAQQLKPDAGESIDLFMDRCIQA